MSGRPTVTITAWRELDAPYDHICLVRNTAGRVIYTTPRYPNQGDAREHARGWARREQYAIDDES